MCTPLDAWYMSYDSRPILLRACLKSLQPLPLLCYLPATTGTSRIPSLEKYVPWSLLVNTWGTRSHYVKLVTKRNAGTLRTSLQLLWLLPLPVVCMKNADLSSVTWQLLVKWWWECEKCDTWRVAFRIRMKCVDCSVKSRLFYFEGLVSISRQVEGKHWQTVQHLPYELQATC